MALKILITGRSLTHEKVGGIVHVSKQLIKEIDKDRFKVRYFTNGGGQQYPGAKVLRPFTFLFDLIRFIIVLIRFRPHLVHINTSLDWKSTIRDEIFLIIAKMLGRQVVFYIHGWQREIGDHFNTHKPKLINSIFRGLFSLPASIVVLSVNFKKNLIHLGLNAKNIFVVPNMVDCDQFTTQLSPVGNYEKMTGSPTILFMSRFVQEKGIYELIKSIPLIRDKGYPDIKLILAGDGEERDNMVDLCRQLKIEDQVQFPGYIIGQRKLDAMKKADLFVFPTSYGEGLPIVVLEALAVGLPIITTSVGGIPELIEHEVNGILLETVNENTIAEAVIYLLNNPDVLSKISEQNLRKARAHYDTPIIVREIEEIYCKTVS